MLTIGLTGGIGTGKSEVARILGELGAVVVDADRLGHAAYRRGTAGFDEVVRAFGRDVVGAAGEIDRKRLGQLVFGDPGRRRKLERIVWPRIEDAIAERLRAERRKGSAAAVVIEAAVLVEAGWDALCDEVWVVTAPEGEVLRRLRGSGMSEEDALARVRVQGNGTRLRGQAAATIVNDGGLEDLRRRVESVWRERVSGKA
ncbi:MAG: dephospho-CoA kinase [Gemmatimonadetes bacterium]|nr:dephospho-CoA kinase [Gemmatimonadota bacterium]